jgi:TrmH family RNA methyltransferase
MISRSHNVARRLRALRKDPALRAAQGVFVAEGMHLAEEALSSFAEIDVAVVSARLGESPEGLALWQRLRESGVTVEQAADATMEGLQDARSPQPVVLVVKRRTWPLHDVLSGRGRTPLVVIACGVQDPGNLGTLMRTAEAAGATGFAATAGSVDLLHPRAVRATMGAIFRIPAIEASLGEILDGASALRLRLVGADARGDDPYESCTWTSPTALLLGAEGSGLPADARKRIDARVRIPMAPGVESLSVGAAAAVLLFEAARARRDVNRAG